MVMKSCIAFRSAALGLVGSWLAATCCFAIGEPAEPLSAGEGHGTLHPVEAGAGYPIGAGIGIRAGRQPGEFTMTKEREPNGTYVSSDSRSIRPIVEVAYNDDAPAPSRDVVKKFTAAEIKVWRARLTELGRIPQDTPNGWSKSPVQPAKLLTVFPELKLREGYVLRAYVFKEDANSNGFVWALPVDAEFPAPEDAPRLESHFLKPPKPFDALDDFMEVIAGDDTPESYLHASLLRRELKEFGGGWHGVRWGVNTVLDDTPWNRPPAGEEESPMMYPESKPEDWKWKAVRPEDWKPEVRLEGEKATVTFYSYTPLAVELDDGKEEKERIIRHTETYRRGKYRPLIVEKKLAEGPNAVAF